MVDESGKPVPEAEIIMDFVGDFSRQLKTVSDKNGEWIRAGMPSGGGHWNLTAKKGKLVGTAPNVKVVFGEMTRVPDIVLREPGAAGAAKPASAGMSSGDVEKANKRQAELKALFDKSSAAIEAGNFDEAITGLEAMIKEIPTCAACYARVGDVYVKKNDMANAEKSYLKAIEIDAKLAGPYGALASIYNQQKKLDEASKMSAKALELMEAGGAAATPGRCSTRASSSGIRARFPKPRRCSRRPPSSIRSSPTRTTGSGMAYVNEGKMADAKAPFQEYLKLAPTGQYADTAKAILATIK